MLKLIDRIVGTEGITWGDIALGIALALSFWFAIAVFLSL